MDSGNPYQAPQTETDFSSSAWSADEPPSIASILFSFRGRIPRRVFWAAKLFTWLAFFIAIIALESGFGDDSHIPALVMPLLFLPVLWISLAVQVKRWHDRDKSAWWILIGLIPQIGPIWVFVEAGCLRGTHGRNRYGPDPTPVGSPPPSDVALAATTEAGAAMAPVAVTPGEETCPWCEQSVIPDEDSRCPTCDRPI